MSIKNSTLKKFLPYGKQSIDQDDIDAVVSVLNSDFLTQGPAVGKFEDAFNPRDNMKQYKKNLQSIMLQSKNEFLMRKTDEFFNQVTDDDDKEELKTKLFENLESWYLKAM